MNNLLNKKTKDIILETLRKNEKKEVIEEAFVAQEKKKPYASKIFKMSEKDLVAGWIALEGTLGLYRDVMKGEEPMIHNSPNLVEIKLREDSNANI